MLTDDEKRDYAIKEISLCHDPAILQDVFFIMLKSNHIFYQQVRAAWNSQRQLNLFEGVIHADFKNRFDPKGRENR